MSSAKTIEKLRKKWPGLEFDVHRSAMGILDSVGVVVIDGDTDCYRVFTCYSNNEAKAVVTIEERLAMLRKALTPVGEDLEEDEGDE